MTIFRGRWLVGISLFTAVLECLAGETQRSLIGIEPCAKEPTYVFLERLQRDEYMRNPESLQALRGTRIRQSTSAETFLVKESLKPNSAGAPALLDSKTAKAIDSAVAGMRLRTCYEDPMVYLVIAQDMHEIETAGKNLRYRMPPEPKYGSSPTADVNASTYFYSVTKERVVVFNNELFRFAGVEAEAAVATIPPESLAHLDRVAMATPSDIMTNFFLHPEWEQSAVAGILSFMHLPLASLTIINHPSDQAYTQLAVPLVKGMNLFVVGHEYGHVINGDFRDSAGVAVWDWKQELNADEIGVKLMAEALRSWAGRYPAIRAQWLYTLRGAILFMRCLEIIDDAKFVDQNNEFQIEPTAEQKELLRRYGDGLMLQEAQLKSIAAFTRSDHPPAWLRNERINYQINSLIKQSSATAEARLNERIANALVTNMSVFWAMSRKDFRRELLKRKGKLGQQ